MGQDLVVINRTKEAEASHVMISKGMEVTQDSTLKLIKKYKNELSVFGRVGFQIVPLETNGGIQKRKGDGIKENTKTKDKELEHADVYIGSNYADYESC